MAFVYILESKRDGRYYTGSTLDIKKRMQHHQKGYTPSTSRFGEVGLVLVREYETLAKARRIENMQEFEKSTISQDAEKNI